MVSIPDWSRLGRIIDAHKAASTQTTRVSLYNKQREADAIKQAEKHGYFLVPTKSFLEDTFLPEPEQPPDKKRSILDEIVQDKDILEVYYVNLSSAHLRLLGDIGMCMYLCVCVLDNNYISRFEALADCHHLFKLDLHSNQISILPGPSFWSNMLYLKVLHLHDNPIGRIDNLQSLAYSPSIVALTMYDTPLSLKRNYRHHMVNSLWSLKALDHYVIADDEIIEDAHFGGRFAAMSPYLALDLCVRTQEELTYVDHIKHTRAVISRINQILSHHSAVLIIQRWMRGYLARKVAKAMQDTVIWATVVIQRQYRKYKGWALPAVYKNKGALPATPPSLPPSTHSAPPPPSTPSIAEPPPANTATDVITVDYDSYMLNRRPGSTTLSEPGQPSKPDMIKESLASKNLQINMNKLESGTLLGLQREASALDTHHLQPGDSAGDIPALVRENKLKHKSKKEEPESKKPQRIRDVRQFFGEVVQSYPAGGDAVEAVLSANAIHPIDTDEEIPVIDFRLQGYREPLHIVDATADMIMSKQEVAREIRLAEAQHHRELTTVSQSSVTHKPRPEPILAHSSDHRYFSRVQGTMGLSCLHAVHQAYKEREKAELNAARMQFVLQKKEQRQAAKHRIRMYQDEKRQRTLKTRDQDRKQLLDQLEHQASQAQIQLSQKTDQRNRTTIHHKQLRRERTFTSDFNIQNTSVSNALMKHDKQAIADDRGTQNVERVQSVKAAEQEQRKIVQQYLEHRKQMRQTEGAVSRAALDAKMLQEANDQLMAARSRVAQQKARSANIRAANPVATSAKSLPPLVDQRHSGAGRRAPGTAMLQRWNTTIAT